MFFMFISKEKILNFEFLDPRWLSRPSLKSRWTQLKWHPFGHLEHYIYSIRPTPQGKIWITKEQDIFWAFKEGKEDKKDEEGKRHVKRSPVEVAPIRPIAHVSWWWFIGWKLFQEINTTYFSLKLTLELDRAPSNVTRLIDYLWQWTTIV